MKSMLVRWLDWVDHRVFGHLLWWDDLFGWCPAWWWNRHVCRPIAVSGWWDAEEA